MAKKNEKKDRDLIVVPELNKDDFQSQEALSDSEPMKAEVRSRRASVPRTLYWLGALPAIGSFKWKKASLDPNKPNIVTTTAFEMWNHENFDERAWVGKCPILQNITVASETFPAFTDMVTKQTGGRLAFNPYPGMIKALTKAQVDRLIENCTNRFVIRENGSERRMVDLDMGKVPKMLESHPKREEIMMSAPPAEEYNEQTDTFVAEYVYLYKLPKAKPSMDPTLYYTLVPTMDEVLMTPPEPLAELVQVKEESAA